MTITLTGSQGSVSKFDIFAKKSGLAWFHESYDEENLLDDPFLG